MIKINENYKKLQASYLFSDIAKRVAAFQKENPDKEVIKMGIGDVTLPLADVCLKAFHKGVPTKRHSRDTVPSRDTIFSAVPLQSTISKAAEPI